MASGSYYLLSHGISTTGTVISYQKASDCAERNAKDSYEVIFETSNGRKITLEKGAGACSNTYKVGNTLAVIYNPDNPDEARFNTFDGLISLPVLAIAIGTICSLLYRPGALTFIRQHFQRNPDEE